MEGRFGYGEPFYVSKCKMTCPSVSSFPSVLARAETWGVLMILAFVVAIVFDEFHGMGWLGALIFVIGASMGALGMYLLKTLRH